MDGREGMRAADTDRQAAAERLRLAVDEGRLDLHEYDERLRLAYGAKTYGELDAVLADLPAPAPAERSGLAPRQPGPGGVSADGPVAAGEGADGVAVVAGRAAAGQPAGWLVEVWTPWLRVAAILTAIWLLASLGSRDAAFFWPLWVLGPWGALLLLRSGGGLVTGEPHREAERRARHRAAREERRRARRERRDGER
ncbi:DUF1707 SHOCT-like domain-containing protein [Micromonospora sp. DT47]|uniref:DUF1707 SHOCT-like domain-containing protein n=1 Tax=Micromonospora sp. DT47 TaxID=3393431 RepID=UPI003CF26943